MLSKDQPKQPVTGNGVAEETPPEKHLETQSTEVLSPQKRDYHGRWSKGVSGNPKGRPKMNDTIVERFRGNENCQSIINKLFAVANTLDDPTPHKDALASVKLIVERLIPSLKSSDLQIETSELGYVILPEVEEDE